MDSLLPDSRGKYSFPYLRPSDIHRVLTFIRAGGVVDPLNFVFWGHADLAAIQDTSRRLRNWSVTQLSAPQWALADAIHGRQKLGTIVSLQPTNWPTSSPIILLTQVLSSFARHHVRIFQPFDGGDGWGHITVAGAHTESVGLRRSFPYLWHKIDDWEQARNLLADDLHAFVHDDNFVVRVFPTQGRWQGRPFDGRVIFVHL